MKAIIVLYGILCIIFVIFIYGIIFKIIHPHPKSYKIIHKYNVYYEYNVYNKDTVAVDTIYKLIK